MLRKPVEASVLFISLLSLFFIGCSRRTAEISSVGGKEIVKCAVSFQPNSLDPVQSNDPVTGSYVMNQVYEGLVAYDENNNLVGRLADSWQMNDECTSVTFHLRRGVKFHNGKDVTAHHFKQSIERACNPKLASPSAPEFLGGIKGAMDCLHGKTNSVDGVKVLNNNTLTVNFTHYSPLLVHRFVYPCARVVDVEAIGGKDVPITELDQAVGTGPYKITEFVSDLYFMLSANESYWKHQPKTKKIQVCIMKDPETIFAKIENNSLDFAELSSSSLHSVMNNPALNNKYQISNMAGVTFIYMDGKNFPALKNKKVRQAIACSIDRKKLETVFQGVPVKLASSIIPYGFPGYRNGINPYGYNPQKARELLKESGYKPGDFKKLEISFYNSNPLPGKIAENIILQLQEVLGIKIKGSGMDIHTFQYKKTEQKFAMALNGWIADYMDPATFLFDTFYSDSVQNNFGYKNWKYDDKVLIGHSCKEYSDRIKMFNLAEDILLEDACVIPITYFQTAIVYSKNIEGFKCNYFHTLPLDELVVEDN